MRVCLLSREFPPDTGWGGIATFVNDLAHGLAQIGEDVTVIALSADGKDSVLRHDGGFVVHRVAPDDSLDDLQMMLSVMPYSHSITKAIWAISRKFFELHAENPFDVVEAPELFGEGFFVGLSKAAPLVVRTHTPHFKFIDDSFHLIDKSFDHQFIALTEKMTLLAADAITSPSADLGEYVADVIGIEKSELKVLTSLVDTEKFKPDGERAIPKRPDRLNVLFIGRLEGRKGVYQLVEAIPEIVKKVPNAHFYLVGKDTNTATKSKSVQAELVSSLARNDVLENVTFTGAVPYSEIPNYIRSADLFVLPSLYDNAPIVCLEAMASGVPVVTTSAGGTKEYVRHGQTGLVVAPADAHALADAIIELLSDAEKRQAFSIESRSAAVKLYSRQIAATRTAEFYRSAREIFAMKKNTCLYKKSTDELLSKGRELLTSFDQMIYKHMYKNSLSFRLSYWFHMAKDRPRLFAATAALGTTKRVLKVFRMDDLPQLRKLEQAIQKK